MSLEEVKNCSSLLDSDKVTERKKAADLLKSLLNNDSIVLTLNSLSKNKRKGSLTWARIFDSSRRFLVKEARKIEKDERSKENPSATIRNGWENQKRNATALSKLILKKACSISESPHIGISTLLEFIFLILDRRENPYLLENFAGDAIHIVHKYILIYPQYYLHVTQTKWKELIRFCMWIYENEAGKTDPVACISVIEGIVKCFKISRPSSTQFMSPSVALRALPQFLVRSFNSSKFSKHYGVEAAFLSLLYTTSLEFGCQWRCFLVSIGEDIMPVVLRMWECRPTQRQILLFKYLNLQLVIHSPQIDGEFIDTCQMCNNQAIWQKYLLRLYLLIDEYIKEVDQDLRRATCFGIKDSGSIPEELITLAARLISQSFIFSNDTTSLDVTQIASDGCSTQSNITSQKNKRRKIEVGWKILLNNLKEEGLQKVGISWLNIFSQVMEYHRNFFTTSRADQLLDLLLYLLSQSKDSQVTEKILWCLNNLSIISCMQPLKEGMNAAKDKWNLVSDHTLRLIAGKQALDSGMQLLKTLISNGCTHIGIDAAIYSFFSRGLLPINKEALELLEVLLLNFPIPKTIPNEGYMQRTRGDCGVKEMLLQLLLPLVDYFDPTSDVIKKHKLAIAHPDILSNILNLICMQDPLKSQKTKINYCQNKQNMRPEFMLEQLYLKSAFCQALRLHVESNTHANSGRKIRFIKETQELVITRFTSFVQQYATPKATSFSKEEWETLLDCLELSICLIAIFKDERLVDLFSKLSHLPNIIENTTSILSQDSSSLDDLQILLTRLYSLFKKALRKVKEKGNEKLLVNLLIHLPQAAQERLLSFITSRVKISPSSSLTQIGFDFQSQNVEVSCPRKASDDSFDVDFDDIEDSNHSVTCTQFQDFEKDGIVTEANIPKCSQITITTDCLSSKDQCIFMATKILSLIFDLSVECAYGIDEDDAPFVKVIEYFLELGKSEEIVDLSLVLVFLNFLFGTKYHAENLSEGIDILYAISAKSVEDSRIVIAVIQCLKDLLIASGTHLNNEQKGNIVHLLKSYAAKLKEGLYGAHLGKIFFETIFQLAKIDPLRSWSHFTLSLDDRISEVYYFLRCPYHDMRMNIVEYMPYVFAHDGDSSKPLPLEHQMNQFQKVYQISIESLSVEGTYSAELISDERICHVSSYLSVLLMVAFASPYLEPVALFAILRSPKTNNIDISLIRRAVCQLAQRNQLSMCEFIKEHLFYLLTQWLKEKYSIEEFPFAVLDCSDFTSFMTEHSNVVIAVLFHQDQDVQIKELSSRIGMELSVLLERNFSWLVASIIPYLVASHKETDEKFKVYKFKINSSKRKWKFLESVFKDVVLASMIEKLIGNIVLDILKMSHDPSQWLTNGSEVVIQPAVIHFESELVVAALCEMHNIFYKNKSSIVKHLAEEKAPLSFILQSLFAEIAGCVDTLKLRWAIAKLETFVKILLPSLATELGTQGVFIIRKATTLLSHFSVQFAAKKLIMLAEKCNTLLLKIVNACIVVDCSILISSVPFLVSRLLGLHTNEPVWLSAYQVLKALFECEDSNLRKVLSDLPLVSSECEAPHIHNLISLHQTIIQQIKGSICLKKLIEEFLLISANDVTTFNLKYLCDMLKEKHMEIGELYATHNLKGEKLAHIFIHRIVAIITLTTEKSRALAGVQCLAKLGPFCLDNAVFDLEAEEENYEGLENKQDLGLPQILLHLSRLVFTTDVELAEATSNALQQILKTKLGYNVYKFLKRSNLDLESNLAPFIPCENPRGSSRYFSGMETSNWETLLNNKDAWGKNVYFESWIKTLTVTLLKLECGMDFFYFLTPVCQINATFCGQVLPFIFHSVLLVDTKKRRDILSRRIVSFIDEHSNGLSGTSSLEKNEFTGPATQNMSRSAIRIFINVVNYLRTKDSDNCFSGRAQYSKWERNFWLNLDYLQLAKAAYLCRSHFSAVLFAEIACDMLNDQLMANLQNSDQSDYLKSLQRHQLSPLLRVAESKRGQEISSLLLQIYNSLEDSDGVEGCSGTSLSTNCIVQSTLNVHRGNWMQALAISDAGNATSSIVDGLRCTGMYNILDSVSQTKHQEATPLLLEARAECCWRLGKWEYNTEEPNTFHQSFFKIVSHLRQNDVDGIESCHENFHLKTISFLRENGNESTASIYPMLAKLQIFSEVIEISKFLSFRSDELSSHLISVESCWDEKDNFGEMEPKLKELILSARITSLKSIFNSVEGYEKLFQPLIFKYIMQKCRLTDSLKIENLCYYEAALLEAKKLPLSTEDSWQLKTEEVHLAMSLNYPTQALRTLDQLLNEIQIKIQNGDRRPIKEYLKTRILYGEILLKSRTCSPISVIDTYFMAAIRDLQQEGSSCSDLLEDSYHKLAELGNRLYEEVNMNLSSDYYEEKIRQVERSKCEKERISKLKGEAAQGSAEHDALRRKIYMLHSEISREEEEMVKQKKDAAGFLNLALKNYFKSITYSSDHSLSIFRIITLWFENLLSTEANQLVSHYSQKIKSHLFIPLLYQLVARLCGPSVNPKHDSTFPSTLCLILERVCKEHPHHGLPSLLMLAHAHLDEDLQRSTSMNSRKATKKNYLSDHPFTEEERVQAAKLLVQQLKKTTLIDHISELEKVCRSYIGLAIEMNGTKKTQSEMQQVKFNSNSSLMRLKNLSFVAPLTRPLKVQPSGKYSPPLILSWDSSGYFVGGINAPIKLCVNSSDGLKTNELLKGNDDLRQDAVLEQVFNVVNELLSKDTDTRKKKLNMRTYAVVPLSQKYGILQWCDNTMTVESFLRHGQSNYYPGENMDEMKKKLVDATRKSKPVSDRIEIFKKILKNFHPVLRHFFYENYPKPELWFSRRQAYTRSVATSSIAGFILGLGDRHVKNLLLDVKTAEIIHIDLGIAFDKGAIMPTPEVVPFRMTQNIVDGLGVFGVEGPLRKGMETTMRVLREARPVLVTIVEVLKHDPLHQWTLTPKQIAKLRNQDSSSQNLGSQNQGLNSASMAERALVRVQQKLNGIQDGQVLSVPEHVSLLLEQATNISNLAVMYYGWQPFL